MTPKTASATSSVDHLDSEALASAQQMLGTQSPTDTVNQALREVVRRRLAKEYIDFLRAHPFENPDETREQAWRRSDT